MYLPRDDPRHPANYSGPDGWALEKDEVLQIRTATTTILAAKLNAMVMEQIMDGQFANSLSPTEIDAHWRTLWMVLAGQWRIVPVVLRRTGDDNGDSVGSADAGSAALLSGGGDSLP